MRVLVLFMCMCVLQCKQKPESKTPEKKWTLEEVTAFGEKMIMEDAIPISAMQQHYKSMRVGDSIHTKVKAKVLTVCQAKGCWMKLQLDSSQTVMVKFKEYGFFVPKTISGKQVIVNGKAFVKEVSVEEQQHFAKDAGKTEAELNQITTPKRTYFIEADGVLLKS